MTYTETWIHSPAALAIAKTLLHSLWQASIAAFVLAACLHFIHTSRYRYASAWAALVIIVAVSILTLLRAVPSSVDRVQLQGIFHSGFAFHNPGAAKSVATESSRFGLQNALPWITPFWLMGVLLFNLRQVASWVAAQRMRRLGVCPAPDVWQQRLNEIRIQLKMAKPVLLLESCLTQVPLVIGHVRPAILAPLGLLAGLPAEQVELILMHELAHIRRCDYVINMFQAFIEGVMFYNPAVWWISRLIRIEREHCCDDMVVDTTCSAHAYAAALAALEESRSPRTEFVLAATGGGLVKRIRRVLHQPERRTSPVAPVFGAAIVIVVVSGLLAARPPLPAAPEVTILANPAVHSITPPPTESIATGRVRQNPNPNPAQMASQDAYKRWLDEDVVYITTEAERTIFLSLRTDQEREQFIEQFWQHRDPTPGTMKNEFKDEHYRRIAYANSNFRTRLRLPSGMGWKTDRGRTYILWGPPDEIEGHAAGVDVRPDGAARTFATQIWRYAYIEGIGNNVVTEFVDLKGTAEYSRVTDPAAGRREASLQAVLPETEGLTVFVIGEVYIPGRYIIREGQNRSVLRALAMAQGLNPRAASMIIILRPKEGSSRVELTVDLRRLFIGADPDFPLQADDIIFVPPA